MTGADATAPGPHRTTRLGQHSGERPVRLVAVPVHAGTTVALTGGCSDRRPDSARMSASRGRRPARPPDARPARGGDRAARSGPVRRAGRLGQDDDPGRPHRLARRRGCRPRTRSRRSRSTSVRPRSSASGWSGASNRSASSRASVRVRTFHALGREILRDAGVDVHDLVDRATHPGRGRARAPAARTSAATTRRSRGSSWSSRVDPRDVAADPAAGPVAQAFVRYEAALAARGALDFDDLVRRALDRLGADAATAGALAGSLPSPARRRGPGRRPEPARTGPPPRGAGEPGLPRR